MGLVLRPAPWEERENAPWEEATSSAELSGGRGTHAGLGSRVQGLASPGRGEGANSEATAGLGVAGLPPSRGLAGGDAAASELRQGQGQGPGPVGERPSMRALCSVLSLQRQSRELALQLRTALRDAASEWRYLRCQGLRRLAVVLREASEDGEVAAVLRESQLYSQLQGTTQHPHGLRRIPGGRGKWPAWRLWSPIRTGFGYTLLTPRWRWVRGRCPASSGLT